MREREDTRTDARVSMATKQKKQKKKKKKKKKQAPSGISRKSGEKTRTSWRADHARFIKENQQHCICGHGGASSSFSRPPGPL
jgi:hypothetical protein